MRTEARRDPSGESSGRRTSDSVALLTVLSWQTYIVFIVIMCMGVFIAACLSPAEKGERSVCPGMFSLLTPLVWRRDGTPIIVQKEATWRAEFAAVAKLAVSRQYLLLLPAFFIRQVFTTLECRFWTDCTSYFYNGFMSTWLTRYFASLLTDVQPRRHR